MSKMLSCIDVDNTSIIDISYEHRHFAHPDRSSADMCVTVFETYASFFSRLIQMPVSAAACPVVLLDSVYFNVCMGDVHEA